MNKENRPAADLFPDESAGETPPGTPSPGSPPIATTHTFFSEFRNPASMGPHASGDEDVECAALIVDGRTAAFGSLQSHVTKAGASSAELAVKYSTNLVTPSWANYGPKVSLATASLVVPRTGSLVTLPDDARIEKLLLKLIRRGGNGTITPEAWNAILTNVSESTDPPPTGSSDPLPQDATWGNVIYDLNAKSPAMLEMYDDDDDVDLFLDQSGRTGFNALSTETLLLPKFKTAAFGGTYPCVEWGGSSVALHTAAFNPTAGYGDWTYYFVMDDMDGGDGALLWGGGFTDSFQFAMYFNDSQFYAACNDLFGSPSCYGTVGTSAMPNKKIVRWVKRSGSAGHSMWVDGVHKCSSTTAPQSNNNGICYLMSGGSGLGCSGRIARVVAYNKIHMNPTTPSGAAGNGHTAPEVALRGYWGIT